MTPRRWALVALGGAALVWALGGEWVSISHGVPESHLLDVTVGLSFFAAGIVALDRRPGNVIGPLMIAFAATWFLGNWGNLPIPVFPTLIFVAGPFGAPLLAHSTLAYPSGRLRTRFDRVVLGAFYAEAVAVGVVGLLTFPRRGLGCVRCPWTPLFFPNRTVFTAVNWAGDRSAVVLVPLFLAAVWLRWQGASQGERRELAPFVGCGVDPGGGLPAGRVRLAGRRQRVHLPAVGAAGRAADQPPDRVRVGAATEPVGPQRGRRPGGRAGPPAPARWAAGGAGTNPRRSRTGGGVRPGARAPGRAPRRRGPRRRGPRR